MARLAEVASHPDIQKHYPAVAYAAQETANVQVRNMGTVAGNLCNAAPSADNAPTLMALGAEAPWPVRPAKDGCPWISSLKDRGSPRWRREKL